MSTRKKPSVLVFEGQLANERVCNIFRKHWITDLPEITLFFIFYLIPFIVLLGYSFYLPFDTAALLWIIASLYFVVFGLALYIHWLNDFFDLFVLTDKRLVDVTQERFLVRRTSVAELNQVQNATYKQKGILDYLFNIGSVDVQTAGNNPDLLIEDIENPEKVTDQILQYSRKYQKDANQ